MGIFDRFRRNADNRPRNSAVTSDWSNDWANFLSSNGYVVNQDTALHVGAVFRCVDLLSKTMATMPLHMFEETKSGKERAKRHRLYPLLLNLPNPYTTAYDFWQMFVANLLLTKGGFAKIERSANGFITALWNIPSRYVDLKVNDQTGERYIVVTDPRSHAAETLYPGQYLYVPNFRYRDDVRPEDPLRIAGDVVGLSADLNAFARTTFSQGINPGGFIEYPNGLSQAAYERMAADFQKQYAGVQNAGKFILLEEGGHASLFERDLEKTQVLESRKFAIAEICRVFGVPPHLCMDMEHATFSNIEQQSMEYVRDAINPLCVRIEQALYRDLLTDAERRKFFFKFNVNSLMRGDTTTRASYYNTMRQNGVLSANDIRELEDMNRLPGDDGDQYLVNGNMITIGAAAMAVPKGAQARLKAGVNNE